MRSNENFPSFLSPGAGGGGRHHVVLDDSEETEGGGGGGVGGHQALQVLSNHHALQQCLGQSSCHQVMSCHVMTLIFAIAI